MGWKDPSVVCYAANAGTRRGVTDRASAIIKSTWKIKNCFLNKEFGGKMGHHHMTQVAVDSYEPPSTLTVTIYLSIYLYT